MQRCALTAEEELKLKQYTEKQGMIFYVLPSQGLLLTGLIKLVLKVLKLVRVNVTTTP
jgi:sialic acid synthase SpsE